MEQMTVTDLYALQAKSINDSWVTHSIYFTENYSFLSEQLDVLMARLNATDTSYRILCLSTNEALLEIK
jgi:hypothetical protein